MFGNVSFGSLAASPLGWGLMLLVVLLEGLLLRRCLPGGPIGSCLTAALVANAVSGLVGFAVSIALDGGWWLVVWVPWVTAGEASRAQWPALATYLAVAFVGSVAIESVVAHRFFREQAWSRLLRVEALVNLVSSLLLLGVFWSIGGVAA